ncbi:MAG TPA: septum formation inhibitor Maf [Firmicutes bacterium]|nr:septum formation inhibitor Maf [Bacillota bacterium]
MGIILASASPRRARLLSQAGIPFRVIPAEVEEVYPWLEPAAAVQQQALSKAEQVAKNLPRGIVLGADTVVLHRGEVLGQPQSLLEARKMLVRLSGDQHRVITGIALVDVESGRKLLDCVQTRVWMKALEKELIDAYISTGEPLDKAGAYGIQGKAALFVDKIEGCYFNVVGLPLSRLCLLLSRMGISPWLNWRESDEQGEADH